MKGTMQVKRLRDNAAYYTAKGYDDYGMKFSLFIEPFVGNDNELFYYVQELDNGMVKIMGEGYIVTDKDSLNRHKKDARKALAGKLPLYYWRDKDGNVIKKSYI